ncbi:M24 family metallopeptidase [Aneurinibacillus terranovensis]|uniref:M24 family metallopeptidase n=1 Tax=Aneurinibacillus terranovensis TaxID=278991 RepID=UPI0004292EA9|nr:M24 family metallopeptidase [Aneurinibacillus terranovensis]
MAALANVNQRIEKVRILMGEEQLDGVLLRKRRSFSWLTDGQVNCIVNTTENGVADLLVTKDTVYCITTKMEAARVAEEELTGLEFEMAASEWVDGTGSVIHTLCGGKVIGTDVPPVLVTGLTGGIDISRKLAELSYVLSDDEMNRYRRLSLAAAKAIEATGREIEPGMTEYEIRSLLASKILPQGINPQVILVATDERIFKYRHPIPTDKKLSNYVMLVLCAEKWGLVANATRFVHFGPLPAEIQENSRKVSRIDLAMNLATRPGVLIKDVFQRGIETYAEVGYAEDWRYLHQGGPTGYESREFLATPASEGVVQLHQAFAWNPAIRGIKSEDTILVLEDGNEFMTHTGEWEYIILEENGQLYKRPGILVR